MPRKRAHSKKLTRSQLDDLLRTIGKEAETIDDEGNPITNEELVAREIYRRALGYEYEEEIQDAHGNKGTITRRQPPERWALEFVFERLEGRAAAAPDPESRQERITAAEKVRELAVERLNKMAKGGANG